MQTLLLDCPAARFKDRTLLPILPVAFLTSVDEGRGLEVVSLCSKAQVHITMPTRKILEAPKLQMPDNYTKHAVFSTLSDLEGSPVQIKLSHFSIPHLQCK